MILIDTSVLIDYLKGIDNLSVRKFEKILSKKIPFGINNYIYQELLQGALNDKEYKSLAEYLDKQIFYDLKQGKQSFKEAADIYLKCRKKGVTVRSTIDLLIVQTAIENKLSLLHNDLDYTNISRVIKELKIY